MSTSPNRSPPSQPVAPSAGDFDDFSSAISVAYDPLSVQTGQTRHNAELYLERLKDHPQVWQFCNSKLQQPPAAFSPGETFWACSVLIDKLTQSDTYEAFPVSEKEKFEKTLTEWMANIATQCEITGNNKHVMNKFSQLLVSAFQQSGYPHRWENFFDILFDLLNNGSQLIELWLAVLSAIDVQIVENLRVEQSPRSRDRDTLIKDTMRSKCIPQVANTWYHILTIYYKSHPDICSRCMRIMGPYFAWIDIALVSNEHWVNMLYHFINSVPEQREGAVSCLTELCEKKIADSGSKLSLLHSLRASDCMPEMVKNILQEHSQILGFQMVHNEPNANGHTVTANPDNGEEVLRKVTDLCQVVCLELIDVINVLITNHNKGQPSGGESISDAFAMLNRCLPMLCDLLVCGHSPTSHKIVMNSIRKYIAVVRANPPDLVSRDYLPRILELSLRRLEYPHDFNFSANDDEANVIGELRKQLLIVIYNIAGVNRDLVLQTLLQRVDHLVANVEPNNWPMCEATLRALYNYGENPQSKKAELLRLPESLLYRVMTLLFTSRVPEVMTHRVVSLAIVDLVERYHNFFQFNDPSCTRLLQLVLGQGGARHPDYIVRSRACSMFSGLAKPLKQSLIQSLEPLAQSLQELLSQDLITFKDKCNLYGTIGVLIEPSQNQTDSQSHHHLSVVLQPLAEFLSTATREPQEQKAPQVAQTITYLAFLSKGFSGIASPTMGRVPSEVGTLWKKMASLVVECSQFYCTVQVVREKSILFMNRMIDLLGKGVLEYVMPVMNAVMSHADLTDMPRIVRIPTQLLQRLKGDGVEHVNQFFAPLVQRVLQESPTEWLQRKELMYSEQAREHLELLKAYYGMITQATQPECIGIFLTGGAATTLNTVLETVQQGCLTFPEMEVAKTCYQIMIKFAQAWYSSVPGFADFLATQVIPMTANTIKQDHFNPADLKCSAVAGEIANLYILLFNSAGEAAFMQALSSSLNIPAESLGIIKPALLAGKVNPVRDVIRNWAVALRRVSE